jgi:hypothetical protein
MRGMAYEFEYRGGVMKPTAHQSVKFLLFFVVGGQEIPHYQMLRDGLSVQLKESVPHFSTRHDICKVFVATDGFNMPKRFFSFYVRLADGAAAEMTIHPYPDVAHQTNFYFKAMGKFLTKNETFEVLDEDSPSRHYLRQQSMLPIETLRKMVIIDRSAAKQGIRHVRIGQKKGG